MRNISFMMTMGISYCVVTLSGDFRCYRRVVRPMCQLGRVKNFSQHGAQARHTESAPRMKIRTDCAGRAGPPHERASMVL